MNEKRFTIHKESKYEEEWHAYPFCIKEDGEVVLETIPLSIAEKVRDKLNGQQERIKELEEENATLSELFHACIRGQKRMMQDNEKEEEALEKITKIIYRLNGVSDHE